jgi:hypothetical protein
MDRSGYLSLKGMQGEFSKHTSSKLLERGLKIFFEKGLRKVPKTCKQTRIKARVFQTILPLGRERDHLHQGAAGRHALHGPEPNRGRAARPRHGGQGVQTHSTVLFSHRVHTHYVLWFQSLHTLYSTY